jgi:hypothetical protein
MKKLIPMTRNFGKLINGRCFGMYGMIIFENSKTIQTSLNFNPNYFTLFPNNDLVLLITISFLSLTHSLTNMDMKNQIDMCIFIVNGIHSN